MNEPKKIPQWAVSLMLTLVGVLATISVGLGTYIFTSMASRLDRLETLSITQNQQMAVMQIQIETQAKFCRFPQK